MPALLREAAEYLSAGAKVVWLVDPDRRQVVAINSASVTVLSSSDAIEGGDAFPGFIARVDEFFA